MPDAKVDFTAYTHPVLAVACTDCFAKPGRWCKRPSGHKASDFHKARKIEADAVFIATHGEDASVEHDDKGWRIDLKGRIRKAPEACR